MSAPPDLVIAGNLLIDDVVFADGLTLMGEPGGAALYTALAASLWGAKVAVASVAGSDYPENALETLAARGVDLGGVRRTEIPSLRTWLLYEKAGRQVVHQLGSVTHAGVSPTPEDLPEAMVGCRALHLAPMPLDVQAAWTRSALARAARQVSLDPYEPLRDANLVTWRETLRHVDLLFVSEDELRLGDGAADPQVALERLALGRMSGLIYKRGARGGCLCEKGGARVEWQAKGERVIDPTGAGDAFAGGYLAGTARGATRDAAIEQGVVSASFAIQAWGARGLFEADPAAAEQRQKAWFGARSRA